MSNLVGCPSCSRHVRVGELACPFCGESVAGLIPARRTVRRGVTRAAIVLGTVLTAASCGAASSNSEPVQGQQSEQQQSEQQQSEQSEQSGGEDTGNGSDTRDDESVVAMYGAPSADGLI